MSSVPLTLSLNVSSSVPSFSTGGITNERNQENVEEYNLLAQIGTGGRRRKRAALDPVAVEMTGVTGLPLTTTLQSEASQTTCAVGSAYTTIFSAPGREDVYIKQTKEERNIMLALHRKEQESLPALPLEQIVFLFWGSEDLIKEGVAEINSRESFGIGTVNDPRLGVNQTERNACSTCHLDNMNCPGHQGYIKLPVPLYNPLAYGWIPKLRNCICGGCGGLFLNRTQMAELGILNITNLDDRLKLIEKYSKNKLCPRSRNLCKNNNVLGTNCVQSCGVGSGVGVGVVGGGGSVGGFGVTLPPGLQQGEIQPCLPNPIFRADSIKSKKQLTYICPGDTTKTERVSPIEETIKVFSSVSVEDAELLGFSNGAHPMKFIMTAVPVIPPCVRTASFREGMTGPSLIEDLYKDIIRYAQLYLEDPTKRDKIRRSLINLIEAIVDNSDGKYGKGRVAFKGVKSTVQGKKGLVRGAAMGKRVNFAGRTVAGPDPSLKFGQIGVPLAWASILTVPVTVTNFNRNALQELFKAGKVMRVQPKGKQGQTKTVSKEMIDTYSLQIGDRIHRWLQDGDYVIAGRQPTIHKASMMGFEVVLRSQYTLTYPLPISTPFNLDFDGDETTIHVPQDEESMAEVRSLMNVKQCITSSESNRPMIGLVMDSLTGAYLLTSKDPDVPLDIWNDCLLNITSTDALPSLNERLMRHKVKPYSGKALFSALLPFDFSYRKDDVLIVEGVLIQGVIKKDYIGTKQGSIIQELWRRYGRERTSMFITDATWVIDRWLTSYGFSVGLTDCYPEDPRFKQITEEEITRAKMLVQQMGTKLSDPIEAERQEKHIIAQLNKARDATYTRASSILPESNALNVMVASGAKGAKFNIAQITTMLGQQFFFGERIKPTISGGTRCLPYFEENETLPEARGFCVNSFGSGLNVAEEIFHQAASRQGLMDTALKTAITGYTYRRFVKAMEDLFVYGDGSVRNPAKQIVQFSYGDDGFDAGELQFIKFEEEEIPFFANVNELVSSINASYGWFPGEY